MRENNRCEVGDLVVSSSKFPRMLEGDHVIVYGQSHQPKALYQIGSIEGTTLKLTRPSWWQFLKFACKHPLTAARSLRLYRLR